MKQLVHWVMSRTLFTPRDKIIEQCTTAWCVANILRLIGPMDVPRDPQYKEEFELAQDLAESSYEDPETGQLKLFIGLGSLTGTASPRHKFTRMYRFS
jgi:hypothetical protein